MDPANDKAALRKKLEEFFEHFLKYFKVHIKTNICNSLCIDGLIKRLLKQISPLISNYFIGFLAPKPYAPQRHFLDADSDLLPSSRKMLIHLPSMLGLLTFLKMSLAHYFREEVLMGAFIESIK